MYTSLFFSLVCHTYAFIFVVRVVEVQDLKASELISKSSVNNELVPFILLLLRKLRRST